VFVLIGAANPETERQLIDQHAHASFFPTKDAFEVLGFIDNDKAKWGTRFCGLPVLGGFDQLDALIAQPDTSFVNLITGSTAVRYETSREVVRCGGRLGNLIHPDVDLRGVTVGVGNYIQNDVLIQAGCRIGNNCSLHIGAALGHETTLGHSVFIAHEASISGKVTIGDGTFVGTNATILPGVRIGKWCTIGAGAVVLRDVRDYAVMVGNPARFVKWTMPVHDSGDPCA